MNAIEKIWKLVKSCIQKRNLGPICVPEFKIIFGQREHLTTTDIGTIIKSLPEQIKDSVAAESGELTW